jgi:hypothetical protein
VQLTVAERVCRGGRCSFKVAGSRTLALPAGAHSLRVGARLAHVALRPGAWRVTLATAAGTADARFAVAAR